MNQYVIGVGDIDKTKAALVGGKGANLGEVSRISGIHVPEFFCVTTDAFARAVGSIPEMPKMLARLPAGAHELRAAIEAAGVPEDIAAEIRRAVGDGAYAVRSSATAEDLPDASFAGQQDTYLNVVGADAIVAHVARCWASLFTERAVAYRAQNGFDHRRVQLAVVVQEMVDAEVSGVLFTADPISGHRKVSSIDATFGLGEALVSGRVTPDAYRVRGGAIVEKVTRQSRPALTDEQIVELEQIGRRIEVHAGSPQDIEWCLAHGAFSIVQSRPITTLFPIPEPRDEQNHVYISVGHAQMMTDAMRPLGLTMWQLVAMSPVFRMYAAANRLFVDVTGGLTSPGRENLLNVLGTGDPLVRDALETIIERGDFLPPMSSAPPPRMIKSHIGMSAAEVAAPVAEGPGMVAALVEEREHSLAELADSIQRVDGPAVLEFIVDDIARMKKLTTDPRSMAATMAGINASSWINDHVREWLGESNVMDTIARSLPSNITSEMGPALLDVADVIRPYPAVIEYLEHATDLGGLIELEGGREVRDAILGFLAKYGMRCAGEIDITRDRWAEKPALLVPLLVGNIEHAAPGAGQRTVEERRREALAKEGEILERLRALPDGETKAAEVEQMIGVVRGFFGFREYPKYHMICRYFVYKQALLREADALVTANAIANREDIFYLTFDELRDAVRTQHVDGALIEHRREEQRRFEKLSPPRVITSDGEIIAGRYKRENAPAGALVGLAVSSGVIEGRARIVLAMESAELEDGDILVTPFTDPSWTPLFVSIAGLVTEAGGLMTHGAVVAREYGLPAVVGVERATERIRDGQRIRVNGSDGFVEIL